MLIRCERHTPEDLALWEELEEADRIHGEQLIRSGKVEVALKTILEFSKKGECYASISWGKDSVTLAHLCYTSGLDLLLWHLRGGADYNPYTLDVRDAFLNVFDVTYGEIIASYTEDMTPKERDTEFFRCLSLGGSRYLSGVRAAESAARKKRMLRFGFSTGKASAPLGWWTASDVFGYLAFHDLPVHPNYAMLGGGRWPRDWQRVGALTTETAEQFGRREWEREYYGDVLRRLQFARNPSK